MVLNTSPVWAHDPMPTPRRCQRSHERRSAPRHRDASRDRVIHPRAIDATEVAGQSPSLDVEADLRFTSRECPEHRPWTADLLKVLGPDTRHTVDVSTESYAIAMDRSPSLASER